MVDAKMRASETYMPKYAPGDFVKVEFRDEKSGESEWMWVRVEFADDSRRMVFGWLDSQPIVLSDDFHLGQRLAVSYDNVRDHAKDTEFPRQ